MMQEKIVRESFTGNGNMIDGHVTSHVTNSGRDQCLAAQLHVVPQVVVMETIPLQLTCGNKSQTYRHNILRMHFFYAKLFCAPCVRLSIMYCAHIYT